MIGRGLLDRDFDRHRPAFFHRLVSSVSLFAPSIPILSRGSIHRGLLDLPWGPALDALIRPPLHFSRLRSGSPCGPSFAPLIILQEQQSKQNPLLFPFTLRASGGSHNDNNLKNNQGNRHPPSLRRIYFDPSIYVYDRIISQLIVSIIGHVADAGRCDEVQSAPWGNHLGHCSVS